jgi:hypothetical protein
MVLMPVHRNGYEPGQLCSYHNKSIKYKVKKIMKIPKKVKKPKIYLRKITYKLKKITHLS